MNRAAAAAEMGTRLAALLTDAGMSAADQAGQMKEPLDDAFRALGFAEADLATADSGDPVGLLAMLRLFTLRAVRDSIAIRFDVGISGDSYRLSQTVAALDRLVAQAEAAVEVLFGPGAAAGASISANGGMVVLDLDFLTEAAS